MILLYRIFTYLIYPLLVIIVYYRRILKKNTQVDLKKKIFVSHFDIKRRQDDKLLWFHAASIGEFKSILPLIQKINEISDKNEFF